MYNAGGNVTHTASTAIGTAFVNAPARSLLTSRSPTYHRKENPSGGNSSRFGVLSDTPHTTASGAARHPPYPPLRPLDDGRRGETHRHHEHREHRDPRGGGERVRSASVGPALRR